MKVYAASIGRNQFGKLLQVVQFEPILITRRGRDVAIIMSPDEFRRMANAARIKVNPAVEHLHAESATRWASVYEALAK